MPPASDAPESDRTVRARRSLEIAGDALDVPDAERGAFLEAACRGDAALRGEVEALLGVTVGAGGFLDAGVGRLLDEAAVPDEDLGGYRVVGELGRGGMGVVYAAERVDGTFEKTVALKIAGHASASGEAVRRFERERRVLARLEHPGIARLLDGGVTSAGRPYFIMERVDGAPITDYADDRGLGLEARLGLALDACDAVAHAHRLLVVHRDLKPSNVFVEEDETGASRVKLLDFGIAKALDEADDDALTRTGGALTPAYAAPEQVSGEPVTAATDVYALGVMLYELFVGRRPYAFPTRALAEVARVVREARPTRPSEAVEAGASRPPADGGEGPTAPWAAPARRLRGDLDAILLKALRKEPERRYATAGELAADLRRHLEGLPVEARGDGLGYRASRFVRRHRVGVAAAVALLVALVGGAGAVLWQARETAREAARANATLDYVLGMFEAVDPVELEGGQLRPADLLAPGLRQAAALEAQPLVQASLLEGLGRLGVSLGEFALADSVLGRAVEARRRVQGPDHPDLAAPLTLLAQSRTAQREYDAALEAGREAVRLLTGEGRPDDLAGAQMALADVLYRRAEDAESRELYRAAVENASAPAVQAQALLGWAVALEETEGLEAALPVYRRATEFADRAFGPTDPRTADALYDYAEAVKADGDTAQAAAQHERALGVYERAYGRGDHRTARSLYTLAVLHHASDPPTAERYYRAALGAYEASSLEADHLWREYTRTALGGLLLRTDRPAEALPLLEAGGAAFAEQLGDDDDRTLLARANWGLAAVRVGRVGAGLGALRAVDAALSGRPEPSAAHSAVLERLETALDEAGRGGEARRVGARRRALE